MSAYRTPAGEDILRESRVLSTDADQACHVEGEQWGGRHKPIMDVDDDLVFIPCNADAEPLITVQATTADPECRRASTMYTRDEAPRIGAREDPALSCAGSAQYAAFVAPVPAPLSCHTSRCNDRDVVAPHLPPAYAGPTERCL